MIEAMKYMYQLLLTEPHAPTLCERLERIAREAIAELESQEPVAVYGYCPECGAKGVMRERRPDGNDKCANGHTYQSCKATHPPQRTWVGLTDEEVELYWDWEDFQTGAGRSTIFEMVKDIEAKLKEKNT